MIKNIIIANNQDLTIHIPKSYVGKRVEVTINPLEELNKVCEPAPTYIATHEVLATDWLTTEEDEAWSNL